MKYKPLIYVTLSAVSVSLYLLAGAAGYRAGFPLDDAWIHQAYARSLALEGSWSFQLGVPSAGSTSPLWSALLAGGHLLRIPPVVWSGLLGVLTLTALALTAARGMQALVPEKPAYAFWAGMIVILEWHLVWAAGSGMETLLFAFGAAFLLLDLAAGRRRPFIHGLWIGAAVWLRPDGLTLLGPAALVYALAVGEWKGKAADLAKLLSGLLLAVAPYMGFNAAVSGAVWPSTLFAKQAEYAALRELPLLQRLGSQISAPLVGVLMLLLPGFVYFGWKTVRARRWDALAGQLWALGMALLYAWRLPVVYQHGRYLIPVIPVWLVWGLAGLALAANPGSVKRWPRVVSRSWLAVVAASAVGFYVLGMQAFGRDVAVIESEMVDTARWVMESTPPEALVAAHDIGALGYFGGRELLDMAGLVTPRVIPILRDEVALRVYLDEQQVDYFVTLEGWYPELESGLEVVFRTGAPYSPALGGTNMVVYDWEAAK